MTGTVSIVSSLQRKFKQNQRSTVQRSEKGVIPLNNLRYLLLRRNSNELSFPVQVTSLEQITKSEQKSDREQRTDSKVVHLQ